MAGKLPEWESELWSYVSAGNSVRCPLYDDCQLRQGDGWCPDAAIGRIRQVRDDKKFSLSKCDFVHGGPYCKIFIMVEMLANKYLRRGGVRYPPVPTDLVSLMDEQLPVEIHSLPLAAYHGATWYLGDRWVIQLRNDDTLFEKRSTLFHEAFHILARRSTSPVCQKRGFGQDSFNELLADHFAACVLMPREWLAEKWEETKDPDRMSKIFCAPESEMSIRLKRMGLI